MKKLKRTKEMAIVRARIFSKMIVNKKYHNLVRLSKYLRQPVAALEFKYKKTKVSVEEGARKNTNLEGVITYRTMRYNQSSISKQVKSLT